MPSDIAYTQSIKPTKLTNSIKETFKRVYVTGACFAENIHQILGKQFQRTDKLLPCTRPFHFEVGGVWHVARKAFPVSPSHTNVLAVPLLCHHQLSC
jgi:hypothetical protein